MKNLLMMPTKSYKTKKPENKKCEGCGILLTSEINQLGYTPVIEKAKLCQRCFKLKYYNEDCQQNTTHSVNHVGNVLNTFNFEKHATFYICSPSQLFFEINEINHLKQKSKVFYLVISQIDCLINTKNLDKIKQQFFNWLVQLNVNINLNQLILTSVYLNINYKEIEKALDFVFAKKLKGVFCGTTNAGKSSIINWILKHKKILNVNSLTANHHKNITQNIKQIRLDKNQYLIDLPGFIDNNSFQVGMDNDQLKKFYSKNSKWKNKIFQLKNDRYFVCENLFNLIVWKNQKNSNLPSSLVTYFNNNLKIQATNLKTNSTNINQLGNEIKLAKYEYNLTDLTNLLVLNKLGFIVLKNVSKITIYIPETISKPILITNAKL